MQLPASERIRRQLVSSSNVAELGGVIIFALVIAGIARKQGISPSIPLLAAGLLVGILPIGPDAPTDPEFFLVVVLAPLVFGEALSSSYVDFSRVRRPILLLAIGLVIFGAYVVGMTAALIVPGMPLAVALSLGAILAPTDAVAVSAVAKRAGLPRRMVHTLEGESLVNDGTALTLLRVSAAAAAAGSVTVVHAGTILVLSVVGGLVVGVIAGWLITVLVRRADDTTVVNGIILVAPFPIYFSAEVIEGSGILAVVAAALIVAHSTSSSVGYSGRLQALDLWRTITFILQAAAFFLVGIEFPAVVGGLDDTDRRYLVVLVPVVFLALVAARFTFVFLMKTLGLSRGESKHAWIVIAWSGTRGPISALAAFTLPVFLDDGVTPFPYRALVISVTFCVVVITLLLAPTIAPLARRLSLPPDDDTEMVLRVRTQMARAALDRLGEIEDGAERSGHPISSDVSDRLRRGAELKLERASNRSERQEDPARSEDMKARTAQHISIEMVHAESQELLRLRDEEGLPDAVMRQFQTELDVRVRAMQVPH